jgi:hypothetical protein
MKMGVNSLEVWYGQDVVRTCVAGVVGCWLQLIVKNIIAISARCLS